MDWSLLGCAHAGHVTYAPEEPQLREHLSVQTASGEAWRCLRCAAFVTGEPQRTGPVEQAPMVRRDKEIRGALILRIFAVERFLRALVFGAAAYVVWRFKSAQESIGQAFNRELPIVRDLFRQLGYNIDHSKLVGLVQHALTLSPAFIEVLAAALAVYAVVEVIEGTGLWLSQRWGEYFAMVVTSLFLPYEIYDLAAKLTVTRSLLFAINLALVLYLLITRRLFGVRGGKRAYEARLRSESVMEAAIAATAVTAGRDTGPGQTATAAGQATGPGQGTVTTSRQGPAAGPLPGEAGDLASTKLGAAASRQGTTAPPTPREP